MQYGILTLSISIPAGNKTALKSNLIKLNRKMNLFCRKQKLSKTQGLKKILFLEKIFVGNLLLSSYS